MSTEKHSVLTKLFEELQVLKTDLTSDLSLYTDQVKSLSWWRAKRRELLYFNREKNIVANPFATEILQNTFPGENYQLSYRGQLNHLLTDFVYPLQTIVVEKDKELSDEDQLPSNIPDKPYDFEPSTDENIKRMQLIVHRRQKVLYQKARENQQFLGEYRELLTYLSHDLSKIAETVKTALGESGTIQTTLPIFNLEKIQKSSPVLCPDEIQPKIYISPQMQMRLFKTLSLYTPGDQHEALSRLIELGNCNKGERVWVKLRADSFAHIFKQARAAGGDSRIESDMTETAKWMSTWFNHGKKNPKSVSTSYTHRVLRGNVNVKSDHQIPLKR